MENTRGHRHSEPNSEVRLELLVENFVFESFKILMKFWKVFKAIFDEIFIQITNCLFCKL